MLMTGLASLVLVKINRAGEEFEVEKVKSDYHYNTNFLSRMRKLGEKALGECHHYI